MTVRWAYGRWIEIVTSLYSQFVCQSASSQLIEQELITLKQCSLQQAWGRSYSVAGQVEVFSATCPSYPWIFCPYLIHTLYIILANTLTLTPMNDWLFAPELQTTQPRVSISQSTALLIVSVFSLLLLIYRYLKSRLSLVSLWICSVLNQFLKWLPGRSGPCSRTTIPILGTPHKGYYFQDGNTSISRKIGKLLGNS